MSKRASYVVIFIYILVQFGVVDMYFLYNRNDPFLLCFIPTAMIWVVMIIILIIKHIRKRGKKNE